MHIPTGFLLIFKYLGLTVHVARAVALAAAAALALAATLASALALGSASWHYILAQHGMSFLYQPLAETHEQAKAEAETKPVRSCAAIGLSAPRRGCEA